MKWGTSEGSEMLFKLGISIGMEVSGEIEVPVRNRAPWAGCFLGWVSLVSHDAPTVTEASGTAA